MADILNKLVMSGCWGKGHQDVDQLVSWMKNYVKNDGQRVRKAIRELNKMRFIGYKNKKKSIYLNKRYRQDIFRFINEHLSE